MNNKIKQFTRTLCYGFAGLLATACSLDKDPISEVTTDMFYNTADHLAMYCNNYYNDMLKAPNSGVMYHNPGVYNDGMIRSDNNTDLFVLGGGNTTLFSAAKNWAVPTGKNLQGDYFHPIRVCNSFFESVLPKYRANAIAGNRSLIDNYIGEMYFMRALAYYKALGEVGDFPIINGILSYDRPQEIVEASKRMPRNEVARYILTDLDSAIVKLAPRQTFQGQRLNRESALLFKSRVALFEATFEKYHRGTGRVPGDANWPGANMVYNQGKTFDIDAEIKFFLEQAMAAAKEVADNAQLTTNSHVLMPTQGSVYGWNPYFEMFSQPSLASVPEVLLWREYSINMNVRHTVPARAKNGSGDGYTRTFVESFLMNDGRPIYAAQAPSSYLGDATLDNLKENRDERLRLFVWGESDIKESDPNSGTQLGALFVTPGITVAESQTRAVTGYQARKYYTYDYAQTSGDHMQGYNACPVFRTAEALLNYMEACYELNGTLDATAVAYWKLLRDRAGISGDYTVTDATTNLDNETDFAVYSGDTKVDVTLYNIRRERMNELFSEGHRYTDLIRWRSFDRLISNKWIPEGVNFWDEMYKRYDNVVADGSGNSNVSQQSLSKYLRPYSVSMLATNQLKDGYSWFKAYYLKPIGLADMLYASPDGSVANTNLYQNPYWPTVANGRAIE